MAHIMAEYKCKKCGTRLYINEKLCPDCQSDERDRWIYSRIKNDPHLKKSKNMHTESRDSKKFSGRNKE